jgi:hypothetical protein
MRNKAKFFAAFVELSASESRAFLTGQDFRFQGRQGCYSRHGSRASLDEKAQSPPYTRLMRLNKNIKEKIGSKAASAIWLFRSGSAIPRTIIFSI